MEYLNMCAATKSVPKLIWVFWFSANMSSNRKAALKQMETVLKVPVILLSDHNITEFLKWPIHPAFYYFSDNHMSDYMQTFFVSLWRRIQRCETHGGTMGPLFRRV